MNKKQVFKEDGVWLESDEDDDVFKNATYVSSPLSGDDERFRYYFIICKQGNASFTEEEKTIVTNGLKSVAQVKNGVIEKIKFEKRIATVKTLVSVEVSIAEFIDGCMDACEKSGISLVDDYLATNNHKPTKKEIAAYLSGKTPEGFFSS